MRCADGRTLTATFDFVSHELQLADSEGTLEVVKLEPKTVSRFHGEVMTALERIGVSIPVWTMPVELESPIRFEDDTVHAAYDAGSAHAFWRALECMRPVFEAFRARFVGKCSPLHFFWGSFDLALTRFSGRSAPADPRADPVMREAYSHEVVSHGFWPGGNGIDAAFYAYAAPEPEGFKAARVEPPGARYDPALNEYVLPYDAVRGAPSPEAALMRFLETTYEQAATLARWPRAALER
jgi:hypothetical protein